MGFYEGLQIINTYMPQLVPFFYTHQIILVFFALGFLLLLFSKYFLPNILSIFLGRYTLGDKMSS
jgi:hypothetical protein